MNTISGILAVFAIALVGINYMTFCRGKTSEQESAFALLYAIPIGLLSIFMYADVRPDFTLTRADFLIDGRFWRVVPLAACFVLSLPLIVRRIIKGSPSPEYGSTKLAKLVVEMVGFISSIVGIIKFYISTKGP